jgi:aryl-alcohol dehydrogenase-like predicted oxidoreductase
VSLQPHYNLLERPLFEGALEDECVKQGIGVIPYWPLAAGFLSGKYRSEADLGKSPRGPGLKKYLNDKGLAVLKALDAAGKKHNASNVTVALAWLMNRKSITAPIVSATSLEQLKTLFAAPALKLDPESLAALDKASAA